MGSISLNAPLHEEAQAADIKIKTARMRTAVSPRFVASLALTCFETRVGLVNNEHPAFTAHDATIFVTLLQRLDGIRNFHN
jgi:hypothetical protein